MKRWKRSATARTKKAAIEKTPLVEFGRAVTLRFKDHDIPALADCRSGYVCFEPPSDDDLSLYYETEYGRDNTQYYSVESGYDQDMTNYHIEVVSNTLSRLGRHDLAGLRIHELGCAFGGVVKALNDHGANATGSDLNATAVLEGRLKKGNDAIQVNSHVDALSKLGRTCDVIYASHTLEHDPALIDTLTMAGLALKPDGLLVAAVPNAFYIRGLLDGFTGHPWAAYPDHLHMLTIGSLGRLCDTCRLDPLLFTTQSLESNEWIRRHFGETWVDQRVQSVWEKALGLGGFGMELSFVLTPRGRRDVADQVRSTRWQIETFRKIEVDLRKALRDLS